MAALRGWVRGNRGEASRLGTHLMAAQVGTWRTFVNVWMGKDGCLRVEVRRDGKAVHVFELKTPESDKAFVSGRRGA